MAGRRDRRHYLAGGGIDLVDARFGDLVEVRAVEGGAGVGGALERARELAALGIEGDQPGTGGGPDAAAVVGDAVRSVAPAKGPYSRTISAARVGACCFVLPVLPRVLLIAWLLSALQNGAAGTIYPSGSAAGSNKIVVNPASGGDSQRCARARSSEPPGRFTR